MGDDFAEAWQMFSVAHLAVKSDNTLVVSDTHTGGGGGGGDGPGGDGPGGGAGLVSLQSAEAVQPAADVMTEHRPIAIILLHPASGTFARAAAAAASLRLHLSRVVPTGVPHSQSPDDSHPLLLVAFAQTAARAFACSLAASYSHIVSLMAEPHFMMPYFSKKRSRASSSSSSS